MKKELLDYWLPKNNFEIRNFPVDNIFKKFISEKNLSFPFRIGFLTASNFFLPQETHMIIIEISDMSLNESIVSFRGRARDFPIINEGVAVSGSFNIESRIPSGSYKMKEIDKFEKLIQILIDGGEIS